ncbi:MAG: nucleoside monophosphate kinase [Phycisphaerae bacterium]
MTRQRKFNAVLLIGGPGSGKGTQGAVLGAFPHMQHLAMGDIFRALDGQSKIGREFLSYSTKGLLVPDELTVRVWKTFVHNRVEKRELDPGRHILLLDGIPRTTDQVELMHEHVQVLKIAHFVIRDQSVLIERLKGRALQGDRPDDADENVIRERLRVYEASTAPVLKSYDASLIAEINADQPPLAVLRDLADCLAGCLPPTI